MVEEEKDPGSEYFDSDVTDRERAIFEGAITLGALYHQFVGTPIRSVESLEKAIKESALAHPFIEDADIQVIEAEKKGKAPFDYPILTGEMIEITLTTRYKDAQVELGMRRIPELDFPLMYIENVSE